jgi:hypothetical protein
MLQSWLYFGLVSQILGVRVPERIFVTTSPSGRRRITTRCLPGCIQDWRSRVQRLAKETQRGCLIRASSHLKTASLVLRFANNPWNQTQIDRVVSLSMAILGSSIDFAVYTTAAELRVSHIDQNYWPESLLLKARMRKAGWCMSEIARFKRQHVFCHVLWQRSSSHEISTRTVP